jgi:hypothetical protein
MKHYRGWEITFGTGAYIATKKGYAELAAHNRSGIERLIDAREFVEYGWNGGRRPETRKSDEKSDPLIQVLRQLSA